MQKKLRFSYTGSKPWIIFWAIFFFPVALVLLATAARFENAEKIYFISYEGSRGWLAFWIIFCFPIALLLLFLNGVALVEDSNNTIVAA